MAKWTNTIIGISWDLRQAISKNGMGWFWKSERWYHYILTCFGWVTLAYASVSGFNARVTSDIIMPSFLRSPVLVMRKGPHTNDFPLCGHHCRYILKPHWVLRAKRPDYLLGCYIQHTENLWHFSSDNHFSAEFSCHILNASNKNIIECSQTGSTHILHTYIIKWSNCKFFVNVFLHMYTTILHF